MGSSSKVYRLSLTAFAILIASSYCGAQLSRDCNVTRLYASKLFMQPGPVHNSSRTGTMIFVCFGINKACFACPKGRHSNQCGFKFTAHSFGNKHPRRRLKTFKELLFVLVSA